MELWLTVTPFYYVLCVCLLFVFLFDIYVGVNLNDHKNNLIEI